jgi:hypothetical protein
MAGISAFSVSGSHAAGTADDTTSGFVVNEQVTLATSPTGSGYAWTLAIPSASSPAQSALDDDTAASPKFTPDVPGLYLLQCVVDSATTYILRIAVVAAAVARQFEGINCAPIADAQIPTPLVGVTIYFSSDLPGMAKKDTAGNVTAL